MAHASRNPRLTADIKNKENYNCHTLYDALYERRIHQQTSTEGVSSVSIWEQSGEHTVYNPLFIRTSRVEERHPKMDTEEGGGASRMGRLISERSKHLCNCQSLHIRM